MCGIAGVVGPNARAHSGRVGEMLAALRHRGPDDVGLVEFDHAVIGTARLSVVDPVHGRQPLPGPGGRTALVCNGEIYGHRRIRAAFSDYPFATGSDCEVILPLYEAHGPSLVHHLPGTFAFALWDDRMNTLLAARDRFGERPLHYAVTADGTLAFASESNALRACGLVGGDIDRESLAHYLRQSYVPPGRSIWSDVDSLGHAELLRWSFEGGVETSRWWEAPSVSWRPTKQQAAEWFRGELDRAVQDQLEADVPVGAFLSGGVDSTTVAAVAGRHHGGIEVFTYDMPGQSEVAAAADTARLHGLDLHVCPADTVDLAEQLEELAADWDEPFGDSSALPTRQLCRFAGERVKVVLTGDGADELLGGYMPWARHLLGEEWDPSDPTSLVAASTGSVGGRLRRRGAARRRGRAEAPAGSIVVQRYAGFREYFSSSELESLGVLALASTDIDTARYSAATAEDISRFDLDHYLPGDVLVKTDRASMLHGLEVRAPFLDVAVAEGCLSLPTHHKVDQLGDKLLLRRAFAPLWPDSVARGDKRGFGAPLQEWLARPDVVELARAHLVEEGSPLFDLVDRDGVRRHAAAGGQATWNLLMLSLWWEHHRSGEGGRDT